jgi:protein-L-isoaspartate(D-aspartate) O-methyltransferase
MTQALDPQPADRVLEIGTGSGYQAAVLSPLVKEVYTIEIVEELGKQAERTLKRLKYKNVFVKVGDGFQGWTEHAPVDKIIVTCSPEDVPQPLIDQLKEGGLMVIPVGERYQQTLYLMRKKDGQLTSEALQPTLFVPMTGLAEKSRDVQPDPLNPKLINGGFEEALNKLGFVPGWYYQRLMTWEEGDAPEGNHYIRFSNQDLGLAAHLMQAVPLDGSSIRELHVSAWIKLDNVQDPGEGGDTATIAVSFYDKNRRDLGVQTIGRLTGTQAWEHIEHDFRVPLETREALLRVGLFGAVGSASFDDVQMEVKRAE